MIPVNLLIVLLHHVMEVKTVI